MKRREWIQTSGNAALGMMAAPYVSKFSIPEAKLDSVFKLSVITD